MFQWMKTLRLWWKCNGCGQTQGPYDPAHVEWAGGKTEYYCAECCNENG